MTVSTATLVADAALAYALLGLGFAACFHWRGLGAVTATAGSVPFRIAITPGVIALWPLLALRWRTAVRDPGRGPGGRR